jgi:hypothetical protein
MQKESGIRYEHNDLFERWKAKLSGAGLDPYRDWELLWETGGYVPAMRERCPDRYFGDLEFDQEYSVLKDKVLKLAQLLPKLILWMPGDVLPSVQWERLETLPSSYQTRPASDGVIFSFLSMDNDCCAEWTEITSKMRWAKDDLDYHNFDLTALSEAEIKRLGLLVTSTSGMYWEDVLLPHYIQVAVRKAYGSVGCEGR